ncbi:MAG: hypothetical protein ABIE92_09010 [bacterium]
MKSAGIIGMIAGIIFFGIGCDSSSTGGGGGTPTEITGGDVSGIWAADQSPYLIMGDISVPEGDTLKIFAGVEVLFQGYYSLNVAGTLIGNGTFSDSIYFTAADESEGWHGVRFNKAVGDFLYCVIEHGHAWGDNPDGKGGGIYADSSSVWLAHCAIRHCSADTSIYGYGGGLYSNQYAQLEFCEISDNSARIGGGLSCSGVANLAGCRIINNSANDGGGIHGDVFSEVSLNSTYIIGNSAVWGGGGGYFASPYGFIDGIDDAALIRYCQISENSAGQFGGGLMFDWGLAPDLINCTLVDNNSASDGAAVYALTAGLSLVNSIISGNEGNNAIFLMDIGSTVTEISYSDFWENGGGNMMGDGVPDSFGNLEGTNANGDSCDTYLNIFLDPAFDIDNAGAYHLSSISPCIDAGDPVAELDPDGSIADMGAFYFPQ